MLWILLSECDECYAKMKSKLKMTVKNEYRERSPRYQDARYNWMGEEDSTLEGYEDRGYGNRGLKRVMKVRGQIGSRRPTTA